MCKRSLSAKQMTTRLHILQKIQKSNGKVELKWEFGLSHAMHCYNLNVINMFEIGFYRTNQDTKFYTEKQAKLFNAINSKCKRVRLEVRLFPGF